MRAAASDSLLTSEDRTGDEAVECAMGNSTVPAAAAPSGPESPTGVTKRAFAGKSAICATAQVRTVNPGPADRGDYPYQERTLEKSEKTQTMIDYSPPLPGNVVSAGSGGSNYVYAICKGGAR